MSKLKIGIKEKTDFTFGDAYKFYKQTHQNPVDSKAYSHICKKINKEIIQKIYEGFILHVPANLGFIGITKSDVNIVFDDKGEVDLVKSNLSTDWGATNKLWNSNPELKHKRYIFHENLHTNGVRHKIVWNRRYCVFKGIKNYRFKPARSFQRNLAKYIFNNPTQEYYDF